VIEDTSSALEDSSKASVTDSAREENQAMMIDFAESGGAVDLSEEVVVGTTAEGDPFSGKFVDLRYVMVKETDVARKFVTPYDLSCDIREVLENPSKSVERGASPCWDVIAFDGQGGRFDKRSGAIVGNTKRGTSVSVPTDDVVYVAYTRFSIWKTFRLALSATALGFMCNGVMHFFEP
jgi:hypothetical protein